MHIIRVAQVYRGETLRSSFYLMLWLPLLLSDDDGLIFAASRMLLKDDADWADFATGVYRSTRTLL